MAREGAVGHRCAHRRLRHSGHRDSKRIVDSGIQHIHHLGRHRSAGLDHIVGRLEVVTRNSAVVVRQLDVARVAERSCGRSVDFEHSAVVVEAAAVDIDPRALCRVDCGKHNVGPVARSAHHVARRRYHKGSQLVDPHITGIDIGEQCDKHLTLGIEQVVLQLGEHSHRSHGRFRQEQSLLPRSLGECAVTQHGVGRQCTLQVVALHRVGHKRRHLLAVTLDGLAQLFAAGIRRSHHHHRRGFAVFGVTQIARVGILSVGLHRNGEFQRVDERI